MTTDTDFTHKQPQPSRVITVDIGYGRHLRGHRSKEESTVGT